MNKTDPYVYSAKRLRAIREKRYDTINDFAFACVLKYGKYFSIQLIQRLETQDCNPRVSNLKVFAEVLECKIEDFLISNKNFEKSQIKTIKTTHTQPKKTKETKEKEKIEEINSTSLNKIFKTFGFDQGKNYTLPAPVQDFSFASKSENEIEHKVKTANGDDF